MCKGAATTMNLIALLSLAAVGCWANEQKTAISVKVPFIFKKDHICLTCKTFEEQALNGNFFADKSLLIKEVLLEPAKVIIMNFPPSWCKTVNLDMIALFLRAELEEDTAFPIEPNNKTSMSFRFFSYGRVNAYLQPPQTIKDPLLISKQRYVIPKYLGQNPVIYFTFGATEECDVIHQFRRRVREAFNVYNDLINIYVDIAHERDPWAIDRKVLIDKIKLFLDYQKCSTRLDLPALAESLKFLSEVLYMHFKKPVYILMDDYDKPLRDIYTDHYFKYNASTFLQTKFIQFYTDFLKATFKTNPHLAKGIITGVLPPLKEVLNASFDSVSECNFLTGKFSEYFGYNEWEVDFLFDSFKVPAPLREQTNLKYGGYHANNKNLRFYNPRSIANAVKLLAMDSYWVKTINVDPFLKNFLKIDTFREKLESLINGNNITISAAHRHFTVKEIDVLINATVNTIDAVKEGNQFADVALMYLYWNGYLTLSTNYHSNDQSLLLKLPNSEIQEHLKKKFYECVEITK